MTPVGLDPGDRGVPIRPEPRPPRQPPNPPPEDDPWNRWREATPIIWQVWRTSGDERVCPICGPLNGLEFAADTGPMPPLHINCRCQRLYAHTEWRLR